MNYAEFIEKATGRIAAMAQEEKDAWILSQAMKEPEAGREPYLKSLLRAEDGGGRFLRRIV